MQNKPLVSKVTLVAVPGLSADQFQRKQVLPFATRMVLHRQVFCGAVPLRPNFEDSMMSFVSQSLLQNLASLRHKPVTLLAKNATVRPGASPDATNIMTEKKTDLLFHVHLRQARWMKDYRDISVDTGQVVASLFAVPHTRARKKYLEALEAGMDGEGADKVLPPLYQCTTFPAVGLYCH